MGDKYRRKRCSRHRRMKTKYGIPDDEMHLYDNVTHCQICELELSSIPHSPQQRCVDHCHTTGEARGVLCRNCNLLIGFAKDDLTILLNSIKYLKTNG